MEQFREIMRVRDIRSKLLYMLGVMLIVRFGSQVPVYGTDPSYLQKILENTDFNLLDMFSGGSFSNMSIFALSITPYITASIIIQLLTIAIPALEELSEDGETGRQKINDYTRYLAAALALMESIAMHAGICLHLHVISGRDPHHIAEAEFKALARALRFAIEPDPRVDGIPSTKGAL